MWLPECSLPALISTPITRRSPAHQISGNCAKDDRVLRIVGHDRAFLLAVQRLDRGVDVQNPRRIEQRRRALAQVPIEPGHPSGSAIAASARRSASPLITLFIPSRAGLTPSHRIEVTCE